MAACSTPRSTRSGHRLALTAIPALAQSYSEGFTFLKAVRERDAAQAQEMVSDPNPAVINYRDDSGEGALHILVRGRDEAWLGFMLARGARLSVDGTDGNWAAVIGPNGGRGWVYARYLRPLAR